MRSPARRLILDGIFWQMPRYLDSKRAAGINASIRWQITRGDERPDTYELQIANGRCKVVRAPRAVESRVTITVDGAEFLRLATGASDPMQAYFKGRVRLAGDIMLAAKLASLFRIPADRRPRAAAAPKTPVGRA
jgi:putative sterol carrier protein